MKLKAITTKGKEGTSSYVVEFMGKTYPVDPGQKEIFIDGVIFPIEHEEAPATKTKTAKK